MLKYHAVMLMCLVAVGLLTSQLPAGDNDASSLGFLGGVHATEVFAEEHHHHDHDHEGHGHGDHEHEHGEHVREYGHEGHAHDGEHSHEHAHVDHAHGHDLHDHEEHIHEGHDHHKHHQGSGHGKPRDHHHGHGHGHGYGHGSGKPHDHHHHGHPNPHTKVQAIDNAEVWKQAVGGTLFVTAGGNAAIVIFLRRDISPNALRVMVSFAVGGLLGDVFLHLLPHAMGADDSHNHHADHDHGEHAHDHSHSTKVGLALLAGILSFFMVEKALRAAGGGGGHGHSHAPPKQQQQQEEEEEEAEQSSRTTGPKSSGLRRRTRGKKADDTTSDDDSNNGKDKKKNKNNNKEPSSENWLRDIQPGAILNMTADTVHNFTDGMAIAAACQVSPAVGRTMIIAVLFHEIPHEVGDFAVLVSQGFSRSMAFKAQFVSALGALLGCVFGCAVSSQQPAAILAFTAGGFIYISLVNIMPDLLENEDSSLKQTAMEVLAICTGIFMMVLIAVYEPHV